MQEYNSYIGGVDMLNRQISLSRTRIGSQNYNEKDSLLVYAGTLWAYFTHTFSPRNAVSTKSKLLGGRVSVDVRLDQIDHFDVPINS